MFKSRPILLTLSIVIILNMAMVLAVENPKVDSLQRSIFSSDARFIPLQVSFDKKQLKQLSREAKVRIKMNRIGIWKVLNEEGLVGLFFTDQVIGKHEYISYALAVDASGRVIRVEILEYLETHGSEVEDSVWRQQFEGLSINNRLKLGDDIDGISGATLSSRNITDGVRKLLILSNIIFATIDKPN